MTYRKAVTKQWTVYPPSKTDRRTIDIIQAPWWGYLGAEDNFSVLLSAQIHNQPVAVGYRVGIPLKAL